MSPAEPSRGRRGQERSENMKKHKKAIIWTVSILAVLAVLAVTSPFWLTAIGMRMTVYPGRYAAQTLRTWASSRRRRST